MHGSKLDKKCMKLIVLLSELRDALDIHRLIGLNAGELRNVGASKILFGYWQKSALESIAIYFCKIFEVPGRNDLNSIPGVLRSLPNLKVPDQQKEDFRSLGERYGDDSEPKNAREYLQLTLDTFVAAHSDSLAQLREFRDTIGAHSDYAASIETLPSHAEFEALFEFALDFYQLVAGSIICVSPASPSRRVGPGMLKLLRSIGIADPRFDFDAGS